MQRAHAGEVRHLMPARDAARDEHRAGAAGRAPPAAAGARRSLATRRSARARSRTIPPCRSSRRRGRSTVAPGMRPSSAFAGATAHRLLVAMAVQHDAATGPRARVSARVPTRHSLSSNSSNSTARRPRACARCCASPRSSAGASSRIADRQLGSKKTSGCPRSAERIAADRCSAAAWRRRLFQQPLRDQRPAAADVRRQLHVEPEPRRARQRPPGRSPDCSSS